MWSHDFIHPPEVVGPRGRKTNFGGDQHRRRQEPFCKYSPPRCTDRPVCFVVIENKLHIDCVYPCERVSL